MKNICKKISFFSILAILSVPASQAHGPSPDASDTLLTTVARSDAIFLGTVLDIQYRVSSPTKNSPNGVPHTFVTYQIKKLIRGRADRQLTLRFAGGPDLAGSFMIQNNVPAITRGDTDVLFVKGGELDDCPLVGCIDGRFRVIRNQMHTSWGIPVLDVDRKGHILIGGKPRFDPVVIEAPRPDFDELVQRPELRESLEQLTKVYSIDDLRKIYERRAPKTVRITIGQTAPVETGLDSTASEEGIEPTIEKPNRKKALSLGKFLNIVARMSQRAPKPKNRIDSIDPDKAFSPYEWKISSLELVSPDSATGSRLSREEREESANMMEGLDQKLD